MPKSIHVASWYEANSIYSQQTCQCNVLHCCCIDFASQNWLLLHGCVEWEFDSSSGYYYHKTNGFCYDPKSGFYYSDAIGMTLELLSYLTFKLSSW